MNLKYIVKHFYFKSKFYLIFAFTQILLVIFLMCYVLRDFRYHLKRTEVLLVEFLVLFLMVIDVFLYSMLNNFRMNKILAFELGVIGFFCLCFIYISFVGMNQLDEDIELLLMVIRMIL